MAENQDSTEKLAPDEAPTLPGSEGTDQPERFLGGGESAPELVGSFPRIEGFTIVRPIGSGGMGVVYEAMQADPTRRVALKVMRDGVFSIEMLHRFRQEAQALGRLQHPGIASIYQLGTYASPGVPQPFFAMEFISGRNLLAHCEAAGLDARARIALLIRICEAVHHAHQMGVVHRDLKPDNILVDDSGQPKILDFGVARLAEGEGATLRTESGVILGTISYMSPEQIGGDPALTDARSDIYSLGVIGFQLLTGKLPIDVRNLPLAMAAGAVANIEPDRLSSINRHFRGDLDTIIGKALEKDKARRYPSAEQLAADLRHYLANEPIEARPPSTFYQLRKFASRNRILFGGVVATFVVLLIGIVGIALQARAAERASQRAEHVSGFLISAFEMANPQKVEGRTVTAREVLDAAAGRIMDQMKNDPATKAELLDAIGNSYLGLLDYAKAAESFGASLDSLRLVGSPDQERIARLHIAIGQSASKLPDEDSMRSAENHLREACAILEQIHPGISRELRDAKMELAKTLIRQFSKLDDNEPSEARIAETLALWEQVRAWTEKLDGRNSALYGYWEGRYSAAFDLKLGAPERERHLREGIRIMQMAKPPDARIGELYLYLGTMESQRKNRTAAEIAFKEALEIYRPTPWKREYFDSLRKVADILAHTNRPAEAEPYFREFIEARERLRFNTAETADLLSTFSRILYLLKKFEEAADRGREGLDIRIRFKGYADPDVPTIAAYLVGLMKLAQKTDMAEDYFRNLAEEAETKLGPNSAAVAELLDVAANAANANGHAEEATVARERAARIRSGG